VKLQVNFYVPNATEMDLFDVIYKEAPRGLMFPLVWTQQEAELREEDAEELDQELFSLLRAARYVWFSVWGLGAFLLFLGLLLLVLAPRSDYQAIN